MSYQVTEPPSRSDRRVVCDQCGSEGTVQIRAYCDWDETLQLWVARDEEDSHYCENCGDSDNGYEWRTITNSETEDGT